MRNPDAFPRPMGWNGHTHHEEHESNEGQVGMSLRDYFAGQALIGVMVMRAAMHDVVDVSQESIAEEAYELADAMLAASAEEAPDA